MTAKNPNAAQVSKILKARTNGWKVTRETGQRIDFNLNQSLGARFPVALVTLPAAAADGAVETLTAAGYHAETFKSTTRSHVVVISQEELDHRQERKERAANAEAEAEKLVPDTAKVRVRATTYPDHARRTGDMLRAEAVTLVAETLRDHDTDVLDTDGISRECLNDWDLFPLKDRMAGLRTRIQGKSATVLLTPLDESAPATMEPVPALRNVISTNASIDVTEEYAAAVEALAETLTAERETCRIMDGQPEYRVRLLTYPAPDTGDTRWAVDYNDPASREFEEADTRDVAEKRYVEMVTQDAANLGVDHDGEEERFTFTDVPGMPSYTQD